jgi:DnaK suppressor protein
MKTKRSSSVERAIREVPPGEYMCTAQLEFFRSRLEDERRMLLDNAQSTLEQMQAIVSESDSNDRASTEEKFSLEFRVRDRERKLLKKIEDTLLSIEDGTYGWCVETGEPIGIARLLARSTALLCLEAQERHERYERSYRI